MPVHRTAAPSGDVRPLDALETPGIAEALHDCVEHASSAIAVVEGNTHVVRYANSSFRSLCTPFPPEPGELIGCEVCRAVPGLMSAPLHGLLQDARASDSAGAEVELPQEDPNGTGTVWGITIWPVPAQVDHGGALILQVRDLSDVVAERRHRSEILEQLRAVNERLLLSALREQDLREEAQAANDAKTRFLAIVSHELRTPLNAIMGFEQLMAAGISGPVSEAQQAQLSRIHASSVHLLALIDEILTLARLEAGRELVARDPVAVGELIEEVVQLVSPLASAKELDLTVRWSDPPTTIESDALKIRQILLNLLANAVKFTQRGGITVFHQRDAERIQIRVEDTGIGMSAAESARAFEPFWQADQRMTRCREGTGLGLSVSRNLARLLGGDILLTSEPGRGSAFTLWLPLAQPAPAGE